MRIPSILLATLIGGLISDSMTRQVHAAEDEKGFEKLFDGQSLKGWDGNPKLWKVANGAIVGTTSDEAPLAQNEFLIWQGKVDDFELRLEFRVADRGVGNSGVQYRSRTLPDAGKWVVGGYQADIERTNKYMGILYEERGRGILALPGEDVRLAGGDDGVKKEVIGSLGDRKDLFRDVKAGEWQDFQIVAHENHLTHRINGQTIVNVIDNDAARASKQGILALQVHRGPAMQIEFRNIRLKRLADGASKIETP